MNRAQKYALWRRIWELEERIEEIERGSQHSFGNPPLTREQAMAKYRATIGALQENLGPYPPEKP